MSLFVDSSAWYAAADKGDRSHERAKDVLRTGEALLTTDHVLAARVLGLCRATLRHRLGGATCGS